MNDKFDTEAARHLARIPIEQFWEGQMRQALLWACDVIDAANKALEPKNSP